jgi:hypothetical protein
MLQLCQKVHLEVIILSLSIKILHKLAKVTKKYKENRNYRYFLINNISKEKLDKTDIVIYFFGSKGQMYQINQWIETFKELNKKHKITIVVRSFSVYRKWVHKLPFDVVFCYSLNDLLSFYSSYKPRAIIYINNGYNNFQSLIYEDAMHIHINHGESDKSSDHSNQVKAYDYIFVHGPNGYNNYMKYLINLNPKKLIQTGRPQLDFIKSIKLNTKGKKVIIYAPTWEATHKSMNYTSVDKYGIKIVKQILNSDKYFLIYKPHPNLGANSQTVKESHNTILNLVKNSKNARAITNQDVNNIYPIVDFAIFDMSSIMTDYLNVDKPFILADVFDSNLHNTAEYNVLKACNRLNYKNIDNLLEIIEKEISTDPLKEKRKEIKELYLGNYKKGESIKKFINSITEIIDYRDKEYAKKEKLLNE